MNVLAIESSGPVGSAAACRDDEVLAEEPLGAGIERGRLLVPLVDRIVQQAGWDKRADLDLIAVSQGPGSFTGLRVGLMCAKTLAAFSETPLVGVCSFDAMAHNAPAEYERILTALDARRGDVYAAGYERTGDGMTRVHDPAVMTPEQAAASLGRPFVVLGDALVPYADVLCPAGCASTDEALWRIEASVVARLGRRAFEAGRRDDPLALQPIYLRLPEAEEKRLARERGES